MPFVYNGQDVEVRILGQETIDHTVAGGAITRTHTSVIVRSLVGPEKRAKEGHTRKFAFLLAEFPQNPPSTTSRLVFNELLYEIVDYTTDDVVVILNTRRP